MTITAEDMSRVAARRNRAPAPVGATASTVATTDRAAAIMALPEPRGRPSEARRLAHKTDMSVGEAQAYLQAGNPAAKRPAATGEALAGGAAAPPINRGTAAMALAARVGLKGFR